MSVVTRLTNRAVSLAVLLGLASLVLLTPLSSRGEPGAQATFCLGFILLFGYYLARILDGLRLPSITSYILVGILCGPYLLNLLSLPVVASLERLDDVALAIIALIAGGELRMSILRSRRAALAWVIVGQIIFSMVGAVVAVALLRDHVGAIAIADMRTVIAIGLLFGLITVARSPATTIGVITELRARGPMTEILIGVTVLLDVVVLFLAAFIIPSAETLVSPDKSFSLVFVRTLVIEVAGSVAAGLFFGVVLRVYMRLVRGYLPLFLLAIGLVGSVVCRHYHLEPLLAFMIAGFYVENYSSMGKRLIDGLERSAFPVYVLFFAMSGASINLGALRSMWLLALVMVVVRAGAFYAGVYVASRAVSDLRPYAHSMWSGFLAQAGVTIGIAALIARRFEWGTEIETIALAVVAINQLVGPVALKALLEKKGEAGGMDRARVSEV
jgi:Kef-type K+ transport system membrane component KefB